MKNEQIEEINKTIGISSYFRGFSAYVQSVEGGVEMSADDDIQCKECDGTGMLAPDCEECEGNGWVTDPSDGGTMMCPKCDGEHCSKCNGSGEKD